MGRDKKLADRAAARLEEELARGTHKDIQRIAWGAFVAEHLAHIEGAANAREARQVLTEFGRVQKLTDLCRVTFSDVERYVDHLRSIKNATATRNKKCRYLRGAFILAVRRGYLGKNPMTGWRFEKQKKKRKHRILATDEEAKLIASADRLYGFKMVTLIRFFLETWCRASEATGLRWEDVDFDNSCVTFVDTKSKEDRYVPIAAASGLLSDLRRLKVMTMQDAGPFASCCQLCPKWARILEDAGIPYISRHDLRRTGVTRALLSGMAPVAVQRKAGHSDLATTMRYYCEVDDQDLRKAVDKCYREASA